MTKTGSLKALLKKANAGKPGILAAILEKLKAHPTLAMVGAGTLAGAGTGAAFSEEGAELRGALRGGMLGAGLGAGAGLGSAALREGVLKAMPTAETAMLAGGTAGGVLGGLIGRTSPSPYRVRKMEMLDQEAAERRQRKEREDEMNKSGADAGGEQKPGFLGKAKDWVKSNPGKATAIGAGGAALAAGGVYAGKKLLEKKKPEQEKQSAEVVAERTLAFEAGMDHFLAINGIDKAAFAKYAGSSEENLAVDTIEWLTQQISAE